MNHAGDPPLFSFFGILQAPRMFFTFVLEGRIGQHPTVLAHLKLLLDLIMALMRQKNRAFQKPLVNTPVTESENIDNFGNCCLTAKFHATSQAPAYVRGARIKVLAPLIKFRNANEPLIVRELL